MVDTIHHDIRRHYRLSDVAILEGTTSEGPSGAIFEPRIVRKATRGPFLVEFESQETRTA